MLNHSLIYFISFYTIYPIRGDTSSPFFTLKVIINEGERADYFNIIDQQLNLIGIDLDINIVSWSTMVFELIKHHSYDMTYVGISGSDIDPNDYRGIYSENGSLNVFCF